jgi:hypothetical protein
MMSIIIIMMNNSFAIITLLNGKDIEDDRLDDFIESIGDYDQGAQPLFGHYYNEGYHLTDEWHQNCHDLVKRMLENNREMIFRVFYFCLRGLVISQITYCYGEEPKYECLQNSREIDLAPDTKAYLFFRLDSFTVDYNLTIFFNDDYKFEFEG